jgi:hypothetical protein
MFPYYLCKNSKALEIAGITKDTPDPEGGQIDRNEVLVHKSKEGRNNVQIVNLND